MRKEKINFNWIIWRHFCHIHGGEVMPYQQGNEFAEMCYAMNMSALIAHKAGRNKIVKERLKKKRINYGVLLSKLRPSGRDAYPYRRIVSE